MGDNMANMKEKSFLPALIANNILTNQEKSNYGVLGKDQKKSNTLKQINKTVIGKFLFTKFKSPDDKTKAEVAE